LIRPNPEGEERVFTGSEKKNRILSWKANLPEGAGGERIDRVNRRAEDSTRQHETRLVQGATVRGKSPILPQKE